MPDATHVVSSLGSEPWNAPWWKPAKGDHSTFLWLSLIHVTAAVGLVMFPLPDWRIAVAALALTWIGGLGTTVAYHRALAHRAVRLSPFVRHPLIFFAMLNGSGAPATWTANHRQHHAKVETMEDVSSPRIGGFWWSHLRWLYQAGNIPISRWSPDLQTAPYRFWNALMVPLVMLSYFGGLMIGLEAFFWLGAIRLVFALHAQCTVNSICHMRKNCPSGEDSSQNLPWLGLLHFFQGEHWHRNHHAKPASARLGWTVWQVDFGWYFIVLAEALGLATNVRRPAMAAITSDPTGGIPVTDVPAQEAAATVGGAAS